MPDPSKGEVTKARLLEVALTLFAERGFDGTTMRDIAEQAGLSLGATYRYYARKEDLVLALYGQLAAAFEERAARLPAGTLAERFAAAMELKLSLLKPYRRAFGALAASALNPDTELGVLGGDTGAIRERVLRAYTAVLADASDAPGEAQQPALAVLLYGVHLLLLLVWLQDRSPRLRTTHAALGLVRDVLSAAAPFLGLPPVVAGLHRIDAVLRPLLGAQGQDKAQAKAAPKQGEKS